MIARTEDITLPETTEKSSARSPSPEFDPLAIGTDLAELPVYKAAGTQTIDFDGLLTEKKLELHEDLKGGCGGQLWPAGMVLSKYMLREHREDLEDAVMYVIFASLDPATIFTSNVPYSRSADECRLELGAGGGLVGLAVAIGCKFKAPLYITDQINMFELMEQNIALNKLQSRVVPLVWNWYVSRLLRFSNAIWFFSPQHFTIYPI